MDLDAFLKGLDAIASRDYFVQFWDVAMKANPPQEYAAKYLTSKAIEANWNMGSFRPESLRKLLEMAKRIRNDEKLLALAAFLHWRIFMERETPSAGFNVNLSAVLDEKELGCFSFVVGLAFLPIYSSEQREYGIPENIISDSLKQLACYEYNFYRGNEDTGINIGQLCWLHVYMPPARYFRLGRLEFQYKKYSLPFHVYRNKADGTTVALCAQDTWFDENGNACFAGCDRPATAWKADFKILDDGVEGIAVMSGGYVQREPVFLPSDEWEPVLTTGDPVVAMHIPSGGGMKPELVRDSMERAFEFYDRYFPDVRIKAITCSSWIFSTQLSECLPPDSNILALQRMVNLVPESCPPNGLWFLFLKYPPYNPETLPRDTSMRRNVADWLAKGNTFRAGAMYITREEVANIIEQ